jgi:uncharacterized MnhB-related membrane protein
MVTAIWLFAFTVAAFEISVVWKVPSLYRFITTNRHGSLIGVSFSIALSVFMSSLFGAAGTIAMGGAVLGTLITAFVYKFRIMELCVYTVRGVKEISSAVKRSFTIIHNSFVDTRDRFRATIATVKRYWFTVRHPVLAMRGEHV